MWPASQWFSTNTHDAHAMPITDDEGHATLGKALYACSEFCDDISIPRFVVVGAQSSGKSSLLNGLIGASGAIPIGTDMTTRVPLEIRLENSPGMTSTTIDVGVQCPDTGTWRSNHVASLPITEEDSSMIEAAIERLTSSFAGDGANVGDCTQSIHMRIAGPNCTGMQLVDMPGLVTVAREDKGQPADIKERILRLCRTYLNGASNALLLLVMASRADLETDIAWEIAKEYDPDGSRTCIVLTKPDFTEGNVLARYLTDDGPSSLRAGLGYHVVYLKDGPVGEKAYFCGQPRFSEHADRVGIPRVAHKISERLKQCMVEQRDAMLQRVRERSDELRQEHQDTKHLLMDNEKHDFDEVVTKLMFSLHGEVFSRGSKTGAQLQCTLSAFGGLQSTLGSGPMHPEDAALIDNVLQSSHGIHMPFGDTLGEVLEAYMRHKAGAMRAAVMQRAARCTESLSAHLRDAVTHLCQQEHAHYPRFCEEVLIAANGALEQSETEFVSRFGGVVDTELDFTWMSPQFRELFRLNEVESTCEKGAPRAQGLVQEYVAATSMILDHALCKHAISVLVKPFARELKFRLSKLRDTMAYADFEALLAVDPDRRRRAANVKAQLQRMDDVVNLLRKM